METKRFKDVRGLPNITLKQRIDRCSGQIGAEHPFMPRQCCQTNRRTDPMQLG